MIQWYETYIFIDIKNIYIPFPNENTIINLATELDTDREKTALFWET